jgi:hypothetical protein
LSFYEYRTMWGMEHCFTPASTLQPDLLGRAAGSPMSNQWVPSAWGHWQ